MAALQNLTQACLGGFEILITMVILYSQMLAYPFGMVAFWAAIFFCFVGEFLTESRFQQSFTLLSAINTGP